MPEIFARAGRRPSLRIRLMIFLMVPMLVIVPLFGAAGYGVARRFDRKEQDRALAEEAQSVARLVEAEPDPYVLPQPVQQLLKYDVEGRSYFAVDSARVGHVAGTAGFPPPPRPPPPGGPPAIYEAEVEGEMAHAAQLRFVPRFDAGEVITVSVAESLHAERRRARELLVLTLGLLALLTLVILVLVWAGVTTALRDLRPLMRRLLMPGGRHVRLTGPDVPVEIRPLTRTIDALLSRLRRAVDAQERFLADAAHQLRTPLAGLQLHVERALGERDPDRLHEVLAEVRELTARAGRTSSQLLALGRSQAPLAAAVEPACIALDELVPAIVAAHVPAALRAGVDLGYQPPAAARGAGTGAAAGAWTIRGTAAGVHALLENLLDNALRYGATEITVGLEHGPEGLILSVEDDGPGVPARELPRLGERFYRPEGSPPGGSGLGLAIVRSIAARLGAQLRFGVCEPHGLRVTVRFPLATLAPAAA